MQATVEGLLEWRVGTFEQWLAQRLARRPRLPGIALPSPRILPSKKMSRLSKPTAKNFSSGPVGGQLSKVSANLPGIARPRLPGIARAAPA